MNRALNAKAFTSAHDIYFNDGEYQPGSNNGKQLLAHELTHVVQQRSNGPAIQRAVSDADVEAEFTKWGDTQNPKKKKDDPTDLWDFVYKLTHDPTTYMPTPKPTDKAKVKDWERNWEMSEVIAKWMFNLKTTSSNSSVQSMAEARANGVLQAMLQVGLVTKALAQAGNLDASNRKDLYNEVLKNPNNASASELSTIVSALASGETDPANMEIVQHLTNANKDNVDKLDADRTKAIFKALLTKFPGHSTLVDAMAEVLMMNPAIRESMATALYAKDFGDPDFLFKVLKHKYFIEPGYPGQDLLGAVKPATMSVDEYNESRHKNDMPFVYKYKQKYYVQYLIDLCAAQKITIAAPRSMDFAGLKAWLEANTNQIGDAIMAKYPSNPDAVIDIYQNIADIFFYHPSDHSIDIKPDKGGSVSHLKEAQPIKEKYKDGKVEKERWVGPSSNRIAADCDVYATYAMRLFTHAGFEPIGYLGIKPKGNDAHRAAHAAALIRKDKAYFIINNKGILKTTIKDDKVANDKKLDAQKAMFKQALADAYATPVPTDMDIYYDDADATGRMSDKFFAEDKSLFRTDLQ
jgi:hypothetical protein